jgi:hypothetical protein
MRELGCGLYSVSWPLSHAVAMFAHLYAVYIAFNAGGLLAAFATFMMPFLAELYWFYDVVTSIGWKAPFAVLIYAVLGLTFVNGLSIGLMSREA